MRGLHLSALMLALALAGCERHEGHGEHDGGHHHHTAPHGGTLVELGDHFANIEVVLDPARSTMTLHILDAHADAGIRLAQPTIAATLKAGGAPIGPVEFAAQASSLTGEKVGDSSQFTAVHQAFAASPSPGFEVTLGEVAVLGRAFKDVVLKVK